MQDPQNMQRQMLYQLQYLRQQRDMIENQLEILNASLNNLINTKTTVDNLKNVKEGDEILIPIGGILNIKADIKQPEKILLYVSQDVVVEKDIAGSIEFIDKLIEQHKEQIKFVSEQFQKIEMSLQNLSQSIQQSAPRQ